MFLKEVFQLKDLTAKFRSLLWLGGVSHGDTKETPH